MMWIIHFVLLLACLNLTKCESVCNNFDTCGKCIGYSDENCVWCAQETMDEPRCQLESYVEINKGWCNAEHINNPVNIKIKEVDDQFGAIRNNVTIQLRPQVMSIRARPGHFVNLNISYKPAEHFPLDVYYLMDNSDTMKNHKSSLVAQANEIYKQLTNMTNNVQLGVGTFVEKPGYPYFDKNRQSNSHAFTNVLSLTKNMDLFQNMIKKISFGANFDDMEAGLDALMQVMACEEEIGWRSGSRRIIVLCTDSPYHSAGDGKMLGITKPNDMQCHLEDNIYAFEMEQDYPSVSQINTVASLGKFKIIFAAIDKVRDVYTSLAKQIVGAKYAVLKEESNIVDIIKEAYIDSVQTIELNYELPHFVQMRLDQNCNPNDKRNCASTYSNPVVNIPASLKVLECPADNKSYELNISPTTLSDKLIIKLDIICSCECEVIGKINPKCNNAGYIQCGICKCVDNSYGDQCQCNKASTGSVNKEEDYSKCLKHSNHTYPCSKRGACNCGKCECDKGYSGKHCEYDDESCFFSDKKLCSGHGNCTLGLCHCLGGWTGQSCSCPTDNKRCKAPYSEEICSGNGECECGKCKCAKVKGKDEKYTGMFCDVCDDCQAKYCKSIESYVECVYINDTNHCRKTLNDTENIDVKFVNKTEITSLEWHGAAWCKKMLEDGSFLIFRYYYNNDEITNQHKLHIIIQKETEAPPIANKWIALLTSIAIIVLIGLLTLIIWKILVDLHDKREYAKFEKESQAQGYDVSLNPLYEGPAVNFSNPLYYTSTH